VAIIVLIWADEVFDLPHLLFHADATPMNLIESILETVVFIPLAIVLLFRLNRLLKQINIMEGFHKVCASCHLVWDPEKGWRQWESYIKEHSEAAFSHGICPDCAKKLYPNIHLDPNKFNNI